MLTSATDMGQAKQSGWRLWWVLSLVTGAALAQALIRQGLPALYPFIQAEMGLSRAQVGLITSAHAIGFAAVALIAGWLTDYLGVKRIVIISLLITIVSTVAFLLAYNFAAVIAVSIFWGIVSSPVQSASTRAVIDWFPVRIRALAMGIKQTGIPIAGTITAATLPAIALVLGWRMAAASTAVLVLAVLASFIFFYSDAYPNAPAAHRFSFSTLQTIFNNWRLVVTLIWGAAFVGLQFVVMTYLMLFAIEQMGLSEILAGGLLAIAQLISIFSRILWGAVSDFVFGGRRIGVLAIIGLITVVWMLGASLMLGEVHGWVGYLIAGLAGLSTLSFHGVYNALIGEQAMPGQIGLTVGVSTTLNAIGKTVIPPVFGYLVDVTGSYGFAWKAAAALALACTLAILLLSREPQPALPRPL